MALAKKVKLDELRESQKGHASTYSTRYFKDNIPTYELPKKSTPADATYQLIKDEMNLDGNPALNLASFVTTWMEPEARQLIEENLHKNFIDHDEYPQTEVIHKRLVNMVARLFNSPDECNSIGTSTVGSSEAIMLAALAHKWNWKKSRNAKRKSTDSPNIIMGADVQVVWEKFARYFDVEPRMIPMEEDRLTINAREVEKVIDENTICVVGILGTTFTGQADDFEGINDLLVKIKREKGWDIPLHIDAASGGFISPFIEPDLKWDFRLSQVKSINVSGHKYGLVYPGIGWMIFRDEEDFPEELIFSVNYLGGEMPTYTLNFSKGSAMVLAQYYNFIRLGIEGYSDIANNLMANAKYLKGQLVDTKRFLPIGDGEHFPVVSFTLKKDRGYSVYDVSEKLRDSGWIVPAYTLPPNAEDIDVLRVVVKENFSRDMVDIFIKDIVEACDVLSGKKKLTAFPATNSHNKVHSHHVA